MAPNADSRFDGQFGSLGARSARFFSRMLALKAPKPEIFPTAPKVGWLPALLRTSTRAKMVGCPAFSAQCVRRFATE